MATNKKKVMVPDTMGQAGWALLRARDDVEVATFPNFIKKADFLELLRASGKVHGVVLGATPYGPDEVAATDGLAVVARIGVGYDAVHVPTLTAQKVPLMTAGTANSPSVAELAVFFMMTLAKRGAMFNTLVQEGRWVADRMKQMPADLNGKTVLIVGFGRIGTRTAKRCAAMEMEVLVHDPYVSEVSIRAAGCEPAPDLDAALARADFLTLHCPKTPETVGLINADRLARMKPSAYLVNTARGGIVDEPALHAALTSGKIAGAGLDVYAQEPPDPNNPLLKLDSVISAPHMAGVTAESVERMADASIRNVLSVFDGAPIRENVINPEVLG
ncbi:D-3-phosphoglycerate dehydrogenase [Stella humosa]|uniref:D-3-phosphoglycerate dehydrogenase n=1 Tax=Stella humosa TaxID=94 RepID=A0A3N1M9S7_9PROT|nr:hydroxyacid dehydrogenase [Stella humosa]ROP99804.1 D-3-phosphoglycerate dehydrogenase [Stella humosa]BBK30968.1 D-3-phosphoglycerate dehydrogenase [Stella humosa]